MLRLRTLNETPPNGMHRFFVEATQTWVPPTERYHAYTDLRDAVVAHYRANLLAVPANLDALIQDQECRSLPGSWCVDSVTGLPGRDGNAADCNSLMVVVQGTRTLLDWRASSSEIVPVDEITRRSAVCAACPYNDTIPGCTACNSDSLKALVAAIVGTTPLPSDASLRSCKVCCCGLAAKVRLPLDVLQRNLSVKQRAALPQACWLIDTK